MEEEETVVPPLDTSSVPEEGPSGRIAAPAIASTSFTGSFGDLWRLPYDTSVLLTSDRVLRDPSSSLLALEQSLISVRSFLQGSQMVMDLISTSHEQQRELATDLQESLEREVARARGPRTGDQDE